MSNSKLLAGLLFIGFGLSLGFVPSAVSGTDTDTDIDTNILARVDGKEIERTMVEKKARSWFDQLSEKRKACRKQVRSEDNQSDGSWRDQASLRLCDHQYEKRKHQAYNAATQRMVFRHIVTSEARSAGTSLNKWTRKHVFSKLEPVSDSEAKSWYKKNRRRINQPYSKVTKRIKKILRKKRRKQAYQDAIKSLEPKYNVEWYLPAFRVDLKTAGYPSRGPEDAPVTLVEFSDFQCPYCKSFQTTLDEILDIFPDRVRVVYRHFPLSSHGESVSSAKAAMCAYEQGEFWEMHDRLFQNQSSLGPDLYISLAGTIGLDVEKFNECYEGKKFLELIRMDYLRGIEAGVRGTPTIFVNGRIANKTSMEQIIKRIESELSAIRPKDPGD